MKKRFLLAFCLVVPYLSLYAVPGSPLIQPYAITDGKPVPVTLTADDDLMAPADEDQLRREAEAEQAAKEEAERLAAEQAAKEEADRLAAEQAAQEEAERLAAEQAVLASTAAVVAAQAVQTETEHTENTIVEQVSETETLPVIAEQAASVVTDTLPAEQSTAEADVAALAIEQAALIEAARLAAEQEQAEAENLAAEQASEMERLSAEEEAEQERMAAEEKAELERLAAEKAEMERMAAEKAELERMAAEQEERERLAAGQQAEPEQIEIEESSEPYDMERIAVLSTKIEGEKVISGKNDEAHPNLFNRYYNYSGKSALSIVSVGYSTYFLVGQESTISSGRDAFERHLIDLQLFEWRVKWFGMQLFNFEFGINSEGKQVKNTDEIRPLYYRGGEQPDELLSASGNTMWFGYKPAVKFFIPCTKWLAFEVYTGIEVDLGKVWQSMSPKFYDDASVPEQNFFFAPYGGIGFALSGVPVLPLEIKVEYRHPVNELGKGNRCNTAIIPQGIYLSVQVHLTAPIGRNKEK